ncbi:MAG: vitamin K epoxide reductase family protein [Chloroflexi bacterium]|nr:vitamin K epoxide reductase family protein [Chloroflexota bacterium]
MSTARKLESLAIPILSLAGALVSAYLVYVKVSGSSLLCTGVGGCEVVNASVYSEIMGIPIAFLGLLMFLVLLGLGIWQFYAINEKRNIALAIFTISLAGMLYSAYLTYIELFVLRAICPWCVTTAVLITAILALSVRPLLVYGQSRVGGA